MLILFIGLFFPREDTKQSVEKTVLEFPTALPYYVTSLDVRNNGFTATICREQVIELQQAGVRCIVRLNGDTANDIGCMSVGAEAALCDSLTKAGYPIRFYYMNIEGRVEQAGEEVANLMSSGGCVVHCRNGVHRAPSMAAYYLRLKGFDRSAIIEEIGWSKLVKNPGLYKKYMVVLPT